MGYKYENKIWTKTSPRLRMKLSNKRIFGVVPGCIPDPKKRFGRFERWVKLPASAIYLYWRTRGVYSWKDMQKGKH